MKPAMLSIMSVNGSTSAKASTLKVFLQIIYLRLGFPGAQKLR